MKQNKNVFSHDIRLKKLSITNFRGFSNLEGLTFEDDLTVLIAQNGGGKTTILDAIAASLRNYTYQLTKSFTSQQYKWDKLDLKNGMEVGWVSLDVLVKYEFEEEVEVLEEGKKDDEVLEKGNEDNYVATFNIVDSIEKEISLRIDINQQGLKHKIDGYLSEQNTSFDFGVIGPEDVKSKYSQIPVLLYFGNTDNIHAEDRKNIIGSNSNIFQVFEDSLIPKRLKVSSFSRWFEAVFKVAYSPDEGTETYKKSVVLLNSIVTSILNRINGEDSYHSLRMKYTIDQDYFALDKRDENNKFGFISFEQLSAGEKIIVTLVADITRRMLVANPDMINELSDSDTSLPGRGIVLIDEIDLHLYPKWQVKLLPALLETFPNIQFVISSHSPLLLQNIETRQIRKIDNWGINTLNTENENDLVLFFFEEMGVDFMPIAYRVTIENIKSEIRDATAVGISMSQRTKMKKMILDYINLARKHWTGPNHKTELDDLVKLVELELDLNRFAE